ncbi:Cell cycle checkpoint control protein rad9b, partial [Dissophora ornata]
MRAIIPSLSVKGFQAVLTCLAKIGDDIIVEARPDRFTLSTINITRSAFASFTFTRTFFESYHLDTRAEAIKHDDKGPYLRCFIKIHKLLYESCPEALFIDDSIETCPSSWRLQPAALMGFSDNFSAKAEEISMKCTQDGISFKTAKIASDEESGTSKRFGTTVVPMSRNAMEQYKLQDNIELTFAMKEFKAVVAFAVTLRLPLDGYFDARSRPFLLAVESENIVSA